MILIQKLGFLIAGVLLISTVYSQQPGFNRYYQLSESNNTTIARSVFENSQGYVTIGHSFYCYTYDSTCGPVSLFFAQYNRSGDLLWLREYSSDTLILKGSSCKAVKSSDSVYEWIIYCEDTISGIVQRFPALVRFNEAGEVTFLKKINKPNNLEATIFHPLISIKTIDSGFLIGCTINGRRDYLMKLNKNLETEWAKTINLQNKKGYIHSLYQTTDSCYLIGLSVYNDNKPKLVYYNKAGQLNWFKDSGSEIENSGCQVIEGSDSSLIVISGYTISYDPYGYNTYNRIQFSAYDKSGQLKSSKIIGDVIQHGNLDGAFLDSDSSVVLYGGEGVGHWYYQNTFFFRTTQSGDSLIYRKIKPLEYFYLNNCTFYDGIPTSDGNLLFCGLQAIDEKTGNYYYHELAWLVKTDWYGCYDVPVITENPTSVIVAENDQALFTIATQDTVLHYEWYFNNTLISQSDSNVLVIQPVSSTSKGEYYCIVKNECGSAKSEVARLDILGTDEKYSPHRLRVYPNPNKGQFHLLNAKPTDLENITVYNSMGFKVKHQLMKPDLIVLPDINASGLYFLRCGDITLHMVVTRD